MRLRQSTPSTKTFQVLSTWLNPSNDDTKFWWLTLGGPLALLLEEADYDVHTQYNSLLFVYFNVIGFLGPRPTEYGSPRSWKSFMTDDFTPIEYSWSWETPNSSPKIRFCIEAIGPAAGTEKDPFNQDMTIEMIRSMGLVTDVDWTLFYHFRNSLCGQGMQGSGNQSSYPYSTFMGFEFSKSQIDLKAYFFPVKAEQMGRSWLSVLSETIWGLERLGLKVTSFDHLLDFMINHTKGAHLKIIGVGIDCVIPRNSRLKLYVRSVETSFNSVQTVMSLGGKLQTFSEETLQDLRNLWQSTLDLDEHFASSSSLPPSTHQTAGILYYFDVKAGAPLPEPKLYIPAKHYAPNDETALTGLTSYLSMKSQDTFAERYRRALQGIGCYRDLKSAKGMQTYISCAVQKERLHVTSYISPEIYHRARW